MDGMICKGIYADTSGTITALNATSLDSTTTSLTDMTLTARGSGRVIVSDVFAAWNATFSTESGDFIGVVAEGGFEQGMYTHTKSGDIYLNNFILALGTTTTIESDTGTMLLLSL